MFGRVVFNYTTILKFWGRVDGFILKKEEILRKSFIVFECGKNVKKWYQIII